MFQGSCPDSLMNERVIDLNNAQIANLEHVWPAAHDAIELLRQRVNAGMLDYQDGELPSAPLWVVVRWYLFQREETLDD